MSRRAIREEPHGRVNRDSAVTMAVKQIKSHFVEQKRSQRKPGIHSRSVAPNVVSTYEAAIQSSGITPEEVIQYEEFFDEPWGSSPVGFILPEDEKVKPKLVVQDNVAVQKGGGKTSPRHRTNAYPVKDQVNNRKVKPQKQSKSQSSFNLSSRKNRSERKEDEEGFGKFLGAFENANRKQAGLSLMAKIFGGAGNINKIDWKPRRPYFTWWVTVIQLIIYITVTIVYGIAPVGVGKTEVVGEVLTTKLALEQVSYFEEDNLWIGPREEDLILVGAKYSPCMRKDHNVEEAVAIDYAMERQTACCIRNDGSGCVQSTHAACTSSLSTWNNWTEVNQGYQNRLSGSVCGQDPKYCLDPSSTGAHVWPDDITQWPICKTSSNVTKDENYRHMSCEVIGRPCCTGIQGECLITTREHCDFLRGYFHEEAALCSQVYCLNELCGMTSFLNPSEPDQFYRLFTSLFLHAGLFTLVITIIFQLMIQRDLEKITGWWRMAGIYIGSGIAGSLGSAIFLPYHVEAGPSGSQFGVLACLFVEVLRWNKDNKPGQALAKFLIVLIVLFVFGLLPMIDNYAHLFGFAFGLLLSVAFKPYTSLCKRELGRGARITCTVVCITSAALLFCMLIILFYVYPVYECEYCSYFNCVPITEEFCEGMQVTIGRNQLASE